MVMAGILTYSRPAPPPSLLPLHLDCTLLSIFVKLQPITGPSRLIRRHADLHHWLIAPLQPATSVHLTPRIMRCFYFQYDTPHRNWVVDSNIQTERQNALSCGEKWQAYENNAIGWVTFELGTTEYL